VSHFLHCSHFVFLFIKGQPNNDDCFYRMKKLKLIDASRLAGFESELKLKKFELERCSLLLSESEELKKSLLEDKEKLLEKLDVGN